jgi:hypothetical protein
MEQKKKDQVIDAPQIDLNLHGECTPPGINQMVAPDAPPAQDRVIQVIGTDITMTADGKDGVTMDDILKIKKEARMQHVQVFDREEYFKKNGVGVSRISKKQFPYQGDVIVADVNIAG